MLARLPSLNFVRLCAAMLLAAIALQALGPVRAPLEQRHGSAFAAATYEVALGVQRGERSAAREALAPQPTTPIITAVLPAPMRKLALIRMPAARPDPIGPPLPGSHSWRPAPRGPPTA